MSAKILADISAIFLILHYAMESLEHHTLLDPVAMYHKLVKYKRMSERECFFQHWPGRGFVRS